MISVSDIDIFLISNNIEMCTAWRSAFSSERKVSVESTDFAEFMRRHSVKGVVSPANSFGIMDGGYDAAITEWFGPDLQERVQKVIVEEYLGEQPICSSIAVDIGDKLGTVLIHTPTMRYPGVIRESAVVYHCMRSCLIAAAKRNISSLLVPAFGAATGCVSYSVVAQMMYKAYKQVTAPPRAIDWDRAAEWRF